MGLFIFYGLKIDMMSIAWYIWFKTFTFRGRHASKVTEEEEDEEYLKEEEDGLTGSGNTRLLTQPSCKYLYFGL